MKLRRTMLAIAIACASAAAAAAPARLSLHEAAEQAAAALQRGGMVVAVQQEDETPSVRAYGDLDAPDASTLPARLVFEIGSISKLFTGLLLAQGVIEGKLQLTDTLGELFPAQLANADQAVRNITLEQLATHRSCLPRLPANMAPANVADPYAGYDAARLHAALGELRLDGTPPCESEYSNLGFGVLGQALERVYGKPWAQLVQEKIAVPAGMVDTGQHLTPAQARRFVSANAYDAPASAWTFDAMAAAGALRSTAADMLRLGSALLDEDHVLAPAWTLVTTMRGTLDAQGTQVGLAVLLGKARGETWYWHNGGTGGFRSEFRIYPQSQRVEVLLINNAALEPGAVYARMEPATAAPTPAERARVPIDVAAMQALAGVYAIDRQARFTVLEHDGQLLVRLTGQPFLPVFHSGDDRFYYEAVPAELQFQRGDDGAATGLVLFQNGREVKAARADAPVPQLQFPDAEALQDYVGRYTLAPGATFDVSVRAGTLFAQLTGQPALPVFATAQDRFEYDVVEAALVFERDDSGTVEALVLHQNGAKQRAARER